MPQPVNAACQLPRTGCRHARYCETADSRRPHRAGGDWIRAEWPFAPRRVRPFAASSGLSPSRTTGRFDRRLHRRETRRTLGIDNPILSRGRHPTHRPKGEYRAAKSSPLVNSGTKETSRQTYEHHADRCPRRPYADDAAVPAPYLTTPSTQTCAKTYARPLGV